MRNPLPVSATDDTTNSRPHEGAAPRPGLTGRRGFLKTGAVLAAAGPALAEGAQMPPQGAKERVLVYVGTYSSPQGPEGSAGRGEGIYLFEMNPSTGALVKRKVFPSDSNPSWLAFDRSRAHLYSANETATYDASGSGSVSAYSVDRASGDLRLLNTVSSGGAGPCHLSVHPSGRYVLVANYHGGTIAVLPIRDGGELAPATDVKRSEGTPGPQHAAGAPPGSFAISGHEAPHSHMIETDPSGRFVLASNLGLDRIYVWKLDLEKGTLSANDPAFVALPPGDGPRHFAFHPRGPWLYSLQEEASTLVTFDWDSTKGTLTAKQTLCTLPKGFAGTDFTSEVGISPDGRFVYAANRLHDSIAWFSAGKTGMLTLAGEAWTRGDYPRSFTIDPTGGFLYSCNQRADAIVAFRIDRQTGALTFTGQYTPVGTPAYVLFLT